MEDLKKLKITKTGLKQLRTEELGKTWLRRRKATKGCSDKWWWWWWWLRPMRFWYLENCLWTYNDMNCFPCFGVRNSLLNFVQVFYVHRVQYITLYATLFFKKGMACKYFAELFTGSLEGL